MIVKPEYFVMVFPSVSQGLNVADPVCRLSFVSWIGGRGWMVCDVTKKLFISQVQYPLLVASPRMHLISPT